MAQNRLHTQSRAVQLFGLNERDRAIRLHLQNRLTETQYRRVVLYYGLDGGRPMSQREVAEAEGVAKGPVQRSLEQTEEKLRNDAHLWVLWLLRKNFIGSDLYTSEDKGEAIRQVREAQTQKRPDTITEQEMEEMFDRGFDRIDLRPGDNAWATDRFHPASPYDVEVDSLNEAYGNHEITRLEWQVGLVMARAEDRHPDGTDEARVELRQKLQWAFGGRALGMLSKHECDRRVSRALHTYVRTG